MSDQSMQSDSQEMDAESIQNDENRLKYHLRVPFPNELYATSAMNALGVDPPFMSTKNRKTTIRRQMDIEVLEDGVAYLNIELSCDEKSEGGIEIGSLRTCASSMINNLTLICETIKEFGM